MKPKRLYIAPRFRTWDKAIERLDTGAFVPIPADSDGFCEVYKTQKAFKRDYPKDVPIVVTMVQPDASDGQE